MLSLQVYKHRYTVFFHKLTHTTLTGNGSHTRTRTHKSIKLTKSYPPQCANNCNNNNNKRIIIIIVIIIFIVVSTQRNTKRTQNDNPAAIKGKFCNTQ